MGERIAAAFGRAADDGRAALMPYMMGGFPDRGAADAIASAYADSGADMIELGVPFSDPLADGPVIHEAASRALDAGATLEGVLETCALVSGRVPVVTMVYANTVLSAGPERYASMLADAGGAGAIVPDLPREEGAEIRAALTEAKLDLIPLVAPTTPDERRRRICAEAQGFVYVVSLAGVTGERRELPPHLRELVEAVKEEAAVPAAVGFGIGTPEQAAEVGEIADGVIIGSRLVREAAEAGGADAAAEAVSAFLRDTRAALDGTAINRE